MKILKKIIANLWAKKRARKAIRTYRELKKSDQIHNFLEIREKLYLTNLDVSRKGLADQLMPASQLSWKFQSDSSLTPEDTLLAFKESCLSTLKILLPNTTRVVSDFGRAWFCYKKKRSIFLWFSYVTIIGFLEW